MTSENKLLADRIRIAGESVVNRNLREDLREVPLEELPVEDLKEMLNLLTLHQGRGIDSLRELYAVAHIYVSLRHDISNLHPGWDRNPGLYKFIVEEVLQNPEDITDLYNHHIILVVEDLVNAGRL